MIARIWRGAVRPDDADEYAAYIRDTGFSAYGETAGNRGACCCAATRRTTPSSSRSRCGSHVTRSAGFAGDDIEAAVYYPEDDRFLIEKEPVVKHYEVVDEVKP